MLMRLASGSVRAAGVERVRVPWALRKSFGSKEDKAS